MAQAREDVPAASTWSLGGGDELGLSERPVVQGEANPRTWLLQFSAAGMSAAAAGQEASSPHRYLHNSPQWPLPLFLGKL